MIELKTAGEIDKMAVTGEFVAETLATLSIEAQPGVNLMQLERHARALITDRGATSCYWDYARPSVAVHFGMSSVCRSTTLCCMGMPHDYVLRDGDVLSLDFAVSIDGWAADSAVTVIVGDRADAADTALIDSTQRALDAGIAAAVPGGRLGDISAAIAVSRHRRRISRQRRIRRAWHRSHHARGSAHPQPRTAWARIAAAAGHDLRS